MQKVDLSKLLLIQSVAFKGVFLRMDGKGIRTTSGSGAGKVNCQKSLTTTCVFKLHQEKDGTFTIESVEYPGVFLRLDGSSVKSFSGSGAGSVNCQFGAAEWEHFRLRDQKDGSFAIESVAFPNVYLRMDGDNPQGKDDDFGIVNCQFNVESYECFYFVNRIEMPTAEKLGDIMNKLKI